MEGNTTHNMKLYCISGLGADHRVFRDHQLPEVEIVHIPWLLLEKKETLDHYVNRMMAQIKDEEEILDVPWGPMIFPTFTTSSVE